MIPRISSVTPLPDYCLSVSFDDGKKVIYDVKEDFNLPGYNVLRDVFGLFQQVQLDESRTVVFWSDDVDLPSDALYEYGKVVDAPEDRRKRFIAEPDDFVFDKLVINGKVVKQQDTTE